MVECEEVQESLQWMLDDELDEMVVSGLEGHIEACAGCRSLLQQEGRLRLALRDAAESVRAPLRLRRRLDETLAAEQRRTSPWVRYWPMAAAAAVLLAFVWRGSDDPSLSELREVAARHAGDLPMDVVAAEIGPIRSYLSGQLPFNLRLDDIADSSEEPRELGGRVMRLNNHDTAYLRFDSSRGRVSVFVHEGQKGSLALEGGHSYRAGKRQVFMRRVRGYLTARWYDRGLVYSVVTDMEEEDVPHIIEQVMRR